MKALEIVERVREVVEPELEARGFEVIDIDYKREPIGMVLRFFVDRPGGINLDACAQASDIISGLLDENDILKSSYTLEVSSPGIERRLTKPSHFVRFIGAKALVKAKLPRNGQKRFSGVLIKADESGFTLKTDAGEIDFTYAEVDRANLIFSD